MLQIGNKHIDDGAPPYVIAEVGINARSDIELAKAHIDAAASSGADAVKFQTHIPEAEMARSEMEEIGASEVYETVASNVWSRNEHEELQAHCEACGVDFISTPFSAAGVDILADLDVPAIKIGSGEMENREILDAAAATGKPLLVSTGMRTPEDVQETFDFITQRTESLSFLYCVSAYPTEPEDLNLAYIEELSETYGVPVGFSDHSTGIEAAVLALGYDVAVIEKHFTIDRRLPGPDQSVSIEPEELSRLTDFIEYREQAQGTSKEIIAEEEEVKQWADHSLVTNKDVAAGEQFDEANLTTKRPGTGISASRYFDVLGREAAKDMSADEVVTEGDLT